MESLKIILLCVAAYVIYGICHDQITARICVEYFTVGHPPIFGGIQDPTLLAFGWGVIATWWVGALLGVPAAMLARLGARPKLGWRDLRRPILILMLITTVCAAGSGLFGYLTAGMYKEFGGQRTPTHAYVAVASAHQASYGFGFLGGILILAWLPWRRAGKERGLLRDEIGLLKRENEQLHREIEGERRDQGLRIKLCPIIGG